MLTNYTCHKEVQIPIQFISNQKTPIHVVMNFNLLNHSERDSQFYLFIQKGQIK